MNTDQKLYVLTSHGSGIMYLVSETKTYFTVVGYLNRVFVKNTGSRWRRDAMFEYTKKRATEEDIATALMNAL